MPLILHESCTRAVLEVWLTAIRSGVFLQSKETSLVWAIMPIRVGRAIFFRV